MLASAGPIVIAVVFYGSVVLLFAWMFLVAKPVEPDDDSGSPDQGSQGPQTRGPIGCPFCDHHIADDVAYLGQQVSCPKCHSQFQAPHWKGVSADPDFQNAMIRVVFGIISVGFGLYAMWWAYSG